MDARVRRLPPPQFTGDPGGLMVTFPEPAWLKDVAPEAPEADQTEPGSERGLERADISQPATTREAILQAMRADPETTAEAMAEQIGVSRRTIEKHIKTLREAGTIRRVGGRSAGHWEVLS